MSIIRDEAIKKAADIIVMDIEMSAKRTEVLFPGTKDRTIRAIIAGLQTLLEDVPLENHCDAAAAEPDAKCAESGAEGGCCRESEHIHHKLLPHRRKEMMDTVPLMNSYNHKDRFKAEYYQTKIRYEKLHAMIVKHEAGSLDFKSKCSLDLLKDQAAAMGQYLHCLEVRAEIEGIAL